MNTDPETTNDGSPMPPFAKSIESPAFVISLVLLAMPFLLLIDVFFAHPDNYSSELRTQIVTGVLMVISMVGAFWLGSSFGSMKKTEAATDSAAEERRG